MSIFCVSLYISSKTRLFFKRFSGQIIGQILKKLILISSIVDSISTCCRTLVFDNSFVKFEYFKHNTEIVFKSSTIYFLQCMSQKILLWTVYIKFSNRRLEKYSNKMQKELEKFLMYQSKSFQCTWSKGFILTILEKKNFN